MNKTDIECSNVEYNLLNKDLKYKLHFKKKDWIKKFKLRSRKYIEICLR